MRTLDLVRAEFAKYPMGAEASRIALCIGRDITVVRATITRLLHDGSIVRASMRKVKRGTKGNAIATYMLVDPDTREAIRMARIGASLTLANEERMPKETPHCTARLHALMGAARYEDSADSIKYGGGRYFHSGSRAPTLERGEAMGPWQ